MIKSIFEGYKLFANYEVVYLKNKRKSFIKLTGKIHIVKRDKISLCNRYMGHKEVPREVYRHINWKGQYSCLCRRDFGIDCYFLGKKLGYCEKCLQRLVEATEGPEKEIVRKLLTS